MNKSLPQQALHAKTKTKTKTNFGANAELHADALDRKVLAFAVGRRKVYTAGDVTGRTSPAAQVPLRSTLGCQCRSHGKR